MKVNQVVVAVLEYVDSDHPYRFDHNMCCSEVSKLIDKHANQRVIEELDLLRQKLTHISFTAHCIDEINDRIKELKQE